MSVDPTLLDDSLKSQLPLVEVGVYTPFEPLREPGARLLLTAQGLMLEASNGVYHAITALGSYDSPVRLPYGTVKTGVSAIDDGVAQRLQAYIREFQAIATKHAPKEVLMLVVKAPGRPMRSIHASINETTASLNYLDWVHMDDDEHVILDIHSHGAYGAFFSPTDDRDDHLFRGNLKVSCVIGNADQPRHQQVQRWVSRGHVFLETQPAPAAEH